MRVVIMGCGRTGSRLAALLCDAKHEVVVIDWSDDAFVRLPDDFPGTVIVGNAVDADVLRKAELTESDVFVAASSGDNRNILASQLAQKVFGVKRVVSRIKDPDRADIYRELGLHVDCRTTQGAQAVLDLIGEEYSTGL